MWYAINILPPCFSIDSRTPAKARVRVSFESAPHDSMAMFFINPTLSSYLLLGIHGENIAWPQLLKWYGTSMITC
jgi:hypothetical protein